MSTSPLPRAIQAAARALPARTTPAPVEDDLDDLLFPAPRRRLSVLALVLVLLLVGAAVYATASVLEEAGPARAADGDGAALVTSDEVQAAVARARREGYVSGMKDGKAAANKKAVVRVKRAYRNGRARGMREGLQEGRRRGFSAAYREAASRYESALASAQAQAAESAAAAAAAEEAARRAARRPPAANPAQPPAQP